MTAHWTVRRHWHANEGCSSCVSLNAGLVLSFIACFILLVIAPLKILPVQYII